MGFQLELAGVIPEAPAARVLPDDGGALPEQLYGLSFWQPWLWAMVERGKRVDNRPRPPWERMLGQRIALQAVVQTTAAQYSEAAAWIRERFPWEHADRVAPPNFYPPPLGKLPQGAVVAVARLVDVVTASTDPWFRGPYGWVFEDLVRLPAPVPCRAPGQMQFWPVVATAAMRVRVGYDAARLGAR